jgi:hypothetical protein
LAVWLYFPMRAIGPPLERLGPSVPLEFRFRGSAGAFAQVALVLAAGAGLRLAGFALGWRLCAGFAAILALGALHAWMIAWDLRLDPSVRSYELRRGWRLGRRRVLGGFQDFEKIAAAVSPHGTLHAYLVPRGSGNGYDLLRGRDFAAVRKSARALAETLGIPMTETANPAPRSTADLRRTPAPAGVEALAADAGVELDLTPRALLWKELLRIDDRGIDVSTVLLAPWGSRYPSSRFMPWKDITQITALPKTFVTGLDFGVYWRLKPGWRRDLEHAWRGRCAELKSAASPVPWWGPLWYVWEEWPMTTEKSVHIFHRQGAPLSAGGSLTDEALAWVCDGLRAWGRSLGHRIAGDL